MKSPKSARRSAQRRRAVRRRIGGRHRSSPWWGIVFILLMIALITGFVIILTGEKGENTVTLTTDSGEKLDLSKEGTKSQEETQTKVIKLPEKLDLQDLAETWAKTASGRVGIYIYDLDYREPIAKVGETQNFQTASLYKLFPVYEGYRRIAKGEWDGDSILVGSRTIKQCLDSAIRSSDSTCGEALWAKIGRSTLDEIIKDDYKITNSQISSFVSNPVDIAKMLELFYDHKEFSDETYVTILDSMLNQPATKNGMCGDSACNWRQGLPAGLSSDKIKVYDKVGWDFNGSTWNIYNDAAIVTVHGAEDADASSDHNLIVVVMASGLRSFKEITNFGKQLKSVL